MTVEEIIEFLNKRIENAKTMRELHIKDLKSACNTLNIKDAVKYDNWVREDYFILNELEYIKEHIERGNK